MQISFLMLLVLWIVFVINWWQTRKELDALRSDVEELSRSVRGSPSTERD